jgi:DNA-binding transcriptional ArsR family regulator
MGVTHTHLFTDKQNELARLAKALGHPARIAILEFLLEANACINSDLVEELGLKDLGIIQGTVEGVSVCYCIHPQKWKEMEGLFNGLFGKLGAPTDACC